MTTKEKQLKVLELFGLKVGDKIRFYFNKIASETVSEIVETQYFYAIKEDTFYGIDLLIQYDWKKVEPSLKDEKCKDFNCQDCPIYKAYHIDCHNIKVISNETISEIFNEIKKEADKVEKEIYGEKEIPVEE